ncbi:MAG: universal stress protein [Rhodopirellula sp.]|nr:universal stress protein [Rhodopirellula sp.]
MSLSINRILAAVDFSETSDKAFDYALSLAKVFGAEVVALTILQEPILYQPTTDQSYRDAFEQKMQSNLDAMLHRHTCEGVNVKTAMKQGAPFVEIIEFAESEKCDLIVMGTHGHGPIQHMLLGSVAEKVVRKAKCPVLVVRPDQSQFASP